ncbi:MAG: CheR family methyltransferase [Candidatus Marinimicrobia bacterium]|nr:CheR family methyltransferase [Candidatus Neomarinimicrobiota bacterium]
MPTPIPEPLLAQLCQFLENKMGLAFPARRWPELDRKITLLAQKSTCKDAPAYCDWLFSNALSKSQIEELARQLTIGETYFYRDRKSYHVLEQYVLPVIIESRRNQGKYLRIWSAGCASGEEPYTIAIILRQLIPDIAEWNIHILATDINPDFLEKARKGIYTQWSFRDVPESFQTKYFEEIGKNKYRILPGICDMVHFEYLNLAEDIYPSLTNNTNAMDIIFCRNVMIYFSQNLIGRIAQKFFHSLVEQGYLIVSPVEVSQTLAQTYETVRFQNVTLYRRNPNAAKNKVAIGKEARPIYPAFIHPQPLAKPTQVTVIPEAIQPVISEPAKKIPDREKLVVPEDKFYQDALVAYEQGNYHAAESVLKEIISAKKHHLPAIILLTKVNANLGRLDEALQLCREALEIDKLDPMLHYLQATILAELGDQPASIAALKKTIYLDPDFVLAHFYLGNVNLQLRQTSNARRYFQNALAILSKRAPEEILLASEGMTAGRLKEIIETNQ